MNFLSRKCIEFILDTTGIPIAEKLCIVVDKWRKIFQVKLSYIHIIRFRIINDINVKTANEHRHEDVHPKSHFQNYEMK